MSEDTGAAAEAVAESVTPSEPAEATPDPIAEERQKLNRTRVDMERKRLAWERERKSHEERSASEKKDVEAKIKALEEKLAKAAEAEALVEELKRNPYAGVKRGVIDYRSLTEQILADGNLTPEQTLAALKEELTGELRKRDEKLEKIEKERESERQRQEQEQAARMQRQIAADIDSHLNSNADKYELTIALEQQSEVFEYMKLYYKQHGRPPTVEEAAEAIENVLEMQAKKAASAKKVAALLKSAEQPQTPKTQAKPKPDDARAKALTDQIVTSSATPGETKPRMTDEERLEALKQRARNRAREARDATPKK